MYYLILLVFLFFCFGYLGGVINADGVVLFTFRYPEELADSSFDNTGCEFYGCICGGLCNAC